MRLSSSGHFLFSLFIFSDLFIYSREKERASGGGVEAENLEADSPLNTQPPGFNLLTHEIRPEPNQESDTSPVEPPRSPIRSFSIPRTGAVASDTLGLWTTSLGEKRFESGPSTRSILMFFLWQWLSSFSESPSEEFAFLASPGMMVRGRLRVCNYFRGS